MAEKRKAAVFLCGGCAIGDALDLPALSKVARENRGVASCTTHPFLCGDEGVAAIRAEVGKGANAVVIGACSPRFHASTFVFERPVHTERVSLREMVAWSHPSRDEDTQMLADDLVRMGVARALTTEARDPYRIEVDRKILVVGGGPAGLTAAEEAANAGYDVILVEKEPELGGWLRRFSRTFPTKAPYRDLEAPDLDARVSRVQSHPRITVHLGVTIQEITGQPGQFDVKLADLPPFRVGAIVQATGWKPYDATRLGHLGYGASPDVVTNVQFEELLRGGAIYRPSDGRPARRIAFVQCAGSRDPDHLPYCSAVCCRVSLKQALQVRERDPEAQVFVLYKDIRTPGQFEDFYKRVQEDEGIFLTKGEVRGVRVDGSALVVDVDDTLFSPHPPAPPPGAGSLDPHVEIEADLVVLATGMVPASADGEAIRQHRDAKKTVAKNEPGVELEAAKKTVERLAAHEGTDLLHLTYRQGPDLPALKYGFPDSHFICFPYETRRTGIYVAGCVRAPNDLEGARADAEGATLKAIQTVELTAKGGAVHPRWEDATFPDFHMQRCTSCKRCTEECPFGALDEDEKGTPRPNPARCRRCGTCMGACPERLISFADYSVDVVSSMIKAVNIPDEFEEKPRILAFLCENDAYPALDAACFERRTYNAFVRVLPVRCLGAVNTVWIADALASGFDGILLVGCKSGDDYQCHFVRGSELMGTRSENVRRKLTQLALENDRVQIHQASLGEYRDLPALIDAFAEKVIAMGPNPFKG